MDATNRYFVWIAIRPEARFDHNQGSFNRSDKSLSQSRRCAYPPKEILAMHGTYHVESIIA